MTLLKFTKVEIGNIDVKKEFNYAGDIVEAVWILVNQNTICEAVIGSGNAHSIGEWVEYCFSRINKKWEDFVSINRDYTPEYKTLVSNPRLIKQLGWKPNVNFPELANIMLDKQLSLKEAVDNVSWNWS